MKIKNGFILKEVAGSFIVVAVGERVKDFNAVINLNETGAFLWKKLQEGTTKEDLLKSLLSEYDVAEKMASSDLDAFIEKLTEAGLIE